MVVMGSRVFVTMAMSLDGFITGPDDGPDNPAGTNGMRLMDWLSAGDGGADDDAEGGGEREVMMHGAYTAQEALKAGVLDSIEIQLRPFLLGQGRRLFDGLPAEHIDLELVRSLQSSNALHLRYDVQR